MSRRPATPTLAALRFPSPFGFADRRGARCRGTPIGGGWINCSALTRASGQVGPRRRTGPPGQPQKRGNIGLFPNSDQPSAIEDWLDQRRFHPRQQRRICHLSKILARIAAASRPGRGQHPVPRRREGLGPGPRAQAIGARPAHPDAARGGGGRSGEVKLGEEGALAGLAPSVASRAQGHGAEPAGAAACLIGCGLAHRPA